MGGDDRGTGAREVMNEAVSGPDLRRLAESPLLVALDEAQLEQFIAVGRLERHGDGEMIIRERESGDALYLILEGEVRISSAENPELARLSGDGRLHTQYEGDFFGEMSILDYEARSASAHAVGDVLVFRVGREELFGLFGSNTDLQVILLTNMARILSRRLRVTNKRRLAPLPSAG